MKNLKKIISLVTAFAVSSSLLAGCGKSDVTQQAEKSQVEASASSSASASTEVKPSKIVLYHWDATPVTKEIITQYQNDNPGKEVEFVMTPNAEYPEKLKIALAGGEKVDVFGEASGQELVGIVSKSQALPLDDYIKKNKFDIVPFGAAIEQVKIDGKIFALPTTKVAFVLYYNKTLFNKLNIPEPKQDMTWDEYVALSKQVSRGEGKDKIWGSFMHAWEHFWEMPALQQGKTVLDDDLTEFKKAMQLRIQMENIDKSEMTWMENISTKAHHRDMFAAGNTAMIVAGPWMVGILADFKKQGKINFEYDMAPPPHPAGVPAGTTHGGVGSMCISKNSENIDDAWSFISYYTGVKGSMITAKNKQLPAYTNDEIIKAYIGEGQPYPAHLDVLLKTNVYPQEPLVAGINKIVDIFKQEGELMLTGQKTIEQGFADIEKRRKEVLGK